MSTVNIYDQEHTLIDSIIIGLSAHSSAIWDSITSQMQYRVPFDFADALASGEVTVEIN